MLSALRYYVHGHASTLGRYLKQELILGLFGGVPSVPSAVFDSRTKR